ncbi:hypothetical protein [Cronobacter muytjensii]|uniref:Uncharacterized protein n=1 Tax=Cronobacter muytjensii TaxID=413501 RepID=A0A2T7AT42_9ENTR|nr:hypothetical protein [Cronobacter muytjensii]KAB0882385.1 hypothetical protein FZI19_08390 [Cronobacter muytjensii]MBF4810985.1 hypothetical protein [Cronobacter muytjensii]PUX14671.1 hypothetical protein AUN14_09875 [Cronobacter muytjensii]
MSAKNPTENAISELEMHWLDRTENSAARVIVWRVPASGECVLNGFFALQQHPEGRSLADLFLTLDTPFETGYGYSQALANDFLESVEATPDARPWTGEAFLPCFSAGALRAMLESFARARRRFHDANCHPETGCGQRHRGVQPLARAVARRPGSARAPAADGHHRTTALAAAGRRAPAAGFVAH